MKKSLVSSGLVICLGVVSIGAVEAAPFSQDQVRFGSSYSQAGGQELRQKGRKHVRKNMYEHMNQERFETLKALFAKHINVENFKIEAQQLREERQNERKNLREKIERNVEKISNGIVVTMTSDDIAAIDHLQNKQHRSPRNEEVARLVENISNGIKITITSDNEDLVTKIQNRSERARNRNNSRSHRNFRR